MRVSDKRRWLGCDDNHLLPSAIETNPTNCSSRQSILQKRHRFNKGFLVHRWFHWPRYQRLVHRRLGVASSYLVDRSYIFSDIIDVHRNAKLVLESNLHSGFASSCLYQRLRHWGLSTMAREISRNTIMDFYRILSDLTSAVRARTGALGQSGNWPLGSVSTLPLPRVHLRAS